MTLVPAPPTRILLVDDDPAIRSALRILLGFERDLAVVGEVSGAQDAIDRCSTNDIDIVLMDVQMRVYGRDHSHQGDHQRRSPSAGGDHPHDL